MLFCTWKTRLVYFKGVRKKQKEVGARGMALRHVLCQFGQGLGLGLHHNSVPITPKFLHLGVGALSPALEPRELPGKRGEAEAPLWHEQMAKAS